MNSAGKALSIMVALALFTIFLPSWTADQSAKMQITFQGTASAATQVNNAEEPFAKKTEVVSDPLEPLNRFFFKFNDKLYFWFLKPLATVYSWYFPTGVRTSIRNAFNNIAMPIRVVNNTLQGKFRGAGDELVRFTVNSSLGCGGLFDVAYTHFNMTERDEDLGQTLGVWGMKHIFYINWPFLGSSSLRDTIGTAGDTFLNPLFWLAPDFGSSAGIKAGNILNSTSLRIGEYEDFKKSALDPYISMRDAYIQYRAEELQH